ncbi:MAG TPA: 16S rRNA (guanine(527)-N(7))-methyltransferase RsmG, partial [Nitrospirae bacterium]|nr:16S rRNA (guanine(527)-N(7))-methyltransferase RsmG [Nitrospirota bacterium]
MLAREVLIEGLKSLDIEPDIYKITLFETYLRELLRWNKTYNLTAITDERDIINKHFLDSLLYLKFIMALKGLKND